MKVPDGVTGEVVEFDPRFTPDCGADVVFLCPFVNRWASSAHVCTCTHPHAWASFQDLASSPALGTLIKTSTTIVPTGFIEVRKWCKRDQSHVCQCSDHQFKILIFVGETVGKKYDQGKVSASLLPPQALLLVAEVLEHGAKKYGRDNWRRVENADVRYKDAMMRHILAWLAKEERDRDSKLPHLAHAVCCALFLLEFMSEQQASAGDGPLDRMAPSGGQGSSEGTATG